VLRVCADPNNLPFSNQAGEGFENRLASLLANDRQAALGYTWWPQRRGFLRNTLQASRCDVVVGMPTDSDAVATTRPYYRSSYVLVSRGDADLDISSLDDPRLRQVRIGVQMIGDDGNNSPPAHALSRRGIVSNVAGYSVFGDYARPNPLARIVDAVADHAVDVAIVWGPAAGYFARHRDRPLRVHPIVTDTAVPSMPFAFDISMAARRSDRALAAELDDFIRRRGDDITRILNDYGVPMLEVGHHAAATD